MKFFSLCAALLLGLLFAAQPASAELRYSGTYHFNQFERNQSLCKQVALSLKHDYPYDDLKVSTNGDTVHFDDYKYHERRCYDAGSRELCFGGRSWAETIIDITCYSDGDVHIRYDRPEDASEASEDCMTKDGHTYCNSDDYRDKPSEISRDLVDAIERYQHRGTYRVWVKVKPDDARIKVTNIKPRFENGMYLAPGHYDFEVSKSGYNTRHFSIDHKADTENYSIELERAEKLPLILSTFPDKAKVEILNATPTYEDNVMYLMPGSYRVRVSSPGYETKTFTVKVSEEEGITPPFLALELNLENKKRQCKEVRQAVNSGMYQGKKLTAEQVKNGKENFNEKCAPLGFTEL